MRTLCLLLFCTLPALAARPMTPEDLWKVKRIGAPSAAPDGKWCVVEVTTWNIDKDDSTSNLWLLSTDGKTQKQLTNTTGKNSGPKWSPDGKSIAFISQRDGDDGPQIYVISPDGGEARRVVEHADGAVRPQVVRRREDDLLHRLDLARHAPTTRHTRRRRRRRRRRRARPSSSTTRCTATGTTGSPTASGRWSSPSTSRPASTGTCSRSASDHLPPTEPSASDYDVSPDGKELCFVADSVEGLGTDFNLDLYTLPLDGEAEPKNITTGQPGQRHQPGLQPGRQAHRLPAADDQVLLRRPQSAHAARPRAPAQTRELTGELRPQLPESEVAARRQTHRLRGRGRGLRPHLLRRPRRQEAVRRRPEASPSASIDFATTTARRRLPADQLRLAARRSSRTARAIKRADRSSSTSTTTSSRSGSSARSRPSRSRAPTTRTCRCGSSIRPTSTRRRNGRWCRSSTAGRTTASRPTFSFRWNLHLWAAKGYVVGVRQLPRLVSGFGQKFTDSITGDMATKPMIDIMKATDWFEKQPWIDKNRMAAAGASYGGYMMAWLNGHTDRFKAMVCHAGVYNWHSMMASDIVRGRERPLGALPWGDLDEDRQADRRSASPPTSRRRRW